ncbi:hypothetical protein Acr_26g0006750 [Actinidia rufa]|uniref:Uncharacterized protein n=1 Tax=Actinidia rufa TaxID=165716 RepID=A0A7J0H2Z2_9ERIC|nr:hypothetical protein Acr_26g0006410 [Actinidia rufa]GFZ17405.1 hypothetical protein Acr_26g0006750 [Actinidia rufa]
MERLQMVQTISHIGFSVFYLSLRFGLVCCLGLGSFVALGYPRFQFFQKLGVWSVKFAGFCHSDLFDAAWYLLQSLAFCCCCLVCSSQIDPLLWSWSSAAAGFFGCRLV